MPQSLRQRLTYANVIATLALFIALGGGAYAATQLPKNSVGAKQIKKGAVTPAKFSSSARSTLKGDQGPVGPQGSRGEPGQPGSNGSAVGFAYVEAFSGTITVNPAFAHNLTAANITRSSAGVYCFHDLPFTPRSIMVSGDAHGYYDSLAKGSLTSTAGWAVHRTKAADPRTVRGPGGC